MHNQAPIQRRKSKRIYVGNVPIGDGAPIAVQSMTNTRTTDVAATVNQIKALERVGADIVRVSVPTMDAAEAFKLIKQQVNVPLVADIHFDYRIALKVAEYGVDCLRINPGNIGNEERIRTVVDCARDKNIPIRIGVNAGSLDPRLRSLYETDPAGALVQSALNEARLFEDVGFGEFGISVKHHDPVIMVDAYRRLSQACDYPLHLGITEAGTVNTGIIKSAVGIGALLAEGIGDTFRISLTGDPVVEVRVANEILKSLGLKEYGPTLVACPTCGRTSIDLSAIAAQVEEKLKDIEEPIEVAVMGCVVNGPGEARGADVGIAGGNGEGLIFRKGEIVRKVPEADLVNELFQEIDQILEERKHASK